MAPPGGSVFCPFTCADVLKACRPMCAKVSFRVQPASAATNLELFEVLVPLHGRSVWLWCMWLDWNKVISGKILVDLKRSPRKSPDSAWQGPIFRPLQKGNVFQKGPKSGPSWNQKWPLLAGPFFAPSLAQMCWRLAGPCVRKCLFECNQHLRLRILNWGGPHSRLQFFLLFQVQKIDPSFWQVFPLAQESKRP